MASHGAWEARNLWKRFPGTVALRGVSLEVRPGEVHALIGENGSGKSTLIKVLSGVFAPDGGELAHDGQVVKFESPLAARRAGVATIYQEFSLIRTLTVAENICLGRFPMWAPGVVSWTKMRKVQTGVLEGLGIEVDPDRVVGQLSVAEQQMIEIAKAMAANPSLLIMDEPTTALTIAEAERLHKLVRGLVAQGASVIYVSHLLGELPEVADRVTVLRDGVVTGELDAQHLDPESVIEMMLGPGRRERETKRRGAESRPVLEVTELSADNGLQDVSFSVAGGEVLGLAGATGSGRTEIVRALVGADKVTAGKIVLEGAEVKPKSPARALRYGIGLLQENRRNSLFFNLTGFQNITISRLAKITRSAVLSLRREHETGDEFADRLRIRGNAGARSPMVLSGGNQQKLLLARLLFAQCRVLLLDEPTQGIDVGAKAEVYDLINSLANQGVAIVLVSSDYEELLAMTDRVAILRNRQLVEIMSTAALDEKRLGALVGEAS